MSDQRTVILLAARCAHLEDQCDRLQHLVSLLADAAHQTPYERDLIDRLLQLIAQHP